MFDGLHFEPRRELRGRIVVVLDRVAGARHPGALEARDGMQELELDGDGREVDRPFTYNSVVSSPSARERIWWRLAAGNFTILSSTEGQ